jgi:Protein of unknown function (DUF938)
MTEAQLPFSQSCENNKAVILELLLRLFSERRRVLEIGSGTGQHGSYFAQAMPWLNWQPTELPENLAYLVPRCERSVAANLQQPKALDVTCSPWLQAPLPDALFTANTLHIMPWEAVVSFFAELADAAADSLLVVYGPFNYDGKYTSESNARFDQWLAQRNPASAIRDFEAVNALAMQSGFALEEDNAMPANNRLIAWRRGS